MGFSGVLGHPVSLNPTLLTLITLVDARLLMHRVRQVQKAWLGQTVMMAREDSLVIWDSLDLQVSM